MQSPQEDVRGQGENALRLPSRRRTSPKERTSEVATVMYSKMLMTDSPRAPA